MRTVLTHRVTLSGSDDGSSTAGVTGIAGIDVSVTLGFGCCDVETALATALLQLATSLSRTDSIKRTVATDRCEQSGHVSRTRSNCCRAHIHCVIEAVWMTCMR